MTAQKCVRFASTDEEVIDGFLILKLADDLETLEGSLIVDFDL